ncbi:MAG: TIR domain-containing protein [Pyrinomonadaceae bacterium]
MSAYFVHPDMTVTDQIAREFYSACREELEQYVEVSTIRTSIVAQAVQLTANDALIFFNRTDQNYDPALLALFEAAEKAQIEVFPIACTLESRVPPTQVSTRQSFDVKEQLRQRGLAEANVKTIAVALARVVISRMQPTLSKERMRLFISHRRYDGEELAATVYEELIKRYNDTPFRDLTNVLVGANAQDIIEENLLQSDAVILLDTPRAGESEWIAREIEMALSLNLPIVWVKLGAKSDRKKFSIPPASEPHFDLSTDAPDTQAIDSKLIDDIIDMAFRMSRDAASRVFDQLRRLKSIAEGGKIKLEEIDRKNLVYTVQVGRRGFRYPQRPITHLLQFFGRWPKDVDENSFLPRLKTYTHPDYGPLYDTAILVAPIPAQALTNQISRQLCVDSLDEYVSTLENYILSATDKPDKKGLIISGAFPDAKPEYQQHITSAVHTFARALLDRQGIIIFGGHPTFSPLIFDIARRRRPKDYQKAVRLYLSKFFVSDEDLRRYERQATVIPTEAITDNRASSLTRLRQAMILDEQAAGLVVIGGRTKAGGHTPGINEEVALARAAGLPVFLIGSAGGRAAELGAEYNAAGWQTKPNDLSTEQNEELRLSLDYGVLANMVMGSLKL